MKPATSCDRCKRQIRTIRVRPGALVSVLGSDLVVDAHLRHFAPGLGTEIGYALTGELMRGRYVKPGDDLPQSIIFANKPHECPAGR